MVNPTNEQTNEPTQVQAEGESLDYLLLEAGALDNAPDAGAAALEQAKAKQSASLVAGAAAELFGGLVMIRAMGLPLLPRVKAERLAEVWTDAVLQGAAEAGAAIMVMHGWTMAEAFSKYGPYVMLIGILAGPVVQTRRILQEPEPKPVAVPNGS